MRPSWRPIPWQIVDGGAAARIASPPAHGNEPGAQSACMPLACRDCSVNRLCAPLGLESTERALLDQVVQRKHMVKRAQTLFCTDQPLDYVYAIRSGSFKTAVATEDGRVQITGLHVPGELLGLAAIDSGRHSCDATALETASVCQISVRRLEEAADSIPAIHYQMLRIMSGQIRHNEQLMLLLGKGAAEERLAAFLLGLSRRFAARNFSPTQFNLSVSRGDIGNYIGLAEATVSRLLTRFQDMGFIRVQLRRVELVDLEALRGIARERTPAPAPVPQRARRPA